jgi:hypothetical protein
MVYLTFGVSFPTTAGRSRSAGGSVPIPPNVLDRHPKKDVMAKLIFQLSMDRRPAFRPTPRRFNRIVWEPRRRPYARFPPVPGRCLER